MSFQNQQLHPQFKLNGLDFNMSSELMEFSINLEKEGSPHEVHIAQFIQQWFDKKDTISVQTSGSTGEPQQIEMSKKAMIRSAEATGVFFKLAPSTSALLCLPPQYIAGKMMLVRAMTLGWNLHVVTPEKDALTQYDNEYDFVAMVPYQVYHSIHALRKVKKLIIGGGAVSRDLAARLQNVFTECFATYGMTETITHCAVKRINGLAKSDEFHAMPDIKFSKDDRGCLVVEAPRISEEKIITNDLVLLTSKTTFEWLGRIDNLINSGGIKINPETVEEKLSPFISIPFFIASETNEELGEQLILVLERKTENPTSSYSEAFDTLTRYERPKKIYTVSSFTYTETGKVMRKKTLELISFMQ